MSREGRDEVPTGKTGDAVKSLFKGMLNDYEVIAKLRKQFPNDDDFINKVFEAYKERLDYIRRRAEKFKIAILGKYSSLGVHELIKKAKKFKQKYNLSDDEFVAFINEIGTNKSRWDEMLNAPRGNMASVMGYPDLTGTFGGKLNVKPGELETVQQILKIYAETFSLYRQLILQTLSYTDCSYQAITGKYDSTKFNAYTYIHPIIAALFFPKIRLLENHMLLANLAGIVKNKYESKSITTLHDYELFRDLISDPNDVMCLTNRDSPIADLKLRTLVQVKLWENVINLRSGRYYGERYDDLISLLEGCNNNIFDAADLAFNRDEGALVRRLLGVFSLRPTYVSVRPIMASPMGIGLIHDIGVVPFMQYTTVPMITLRLPVSMNVDNSDGEVDLQSSFEQSQFYVENKAIIQKSQSIIFSRDLLIFYVNRRFHHIDFKLLTGVPNSFTTLPTTFSRFNSLNSSPVAYKDTIQIPTCGIFKLKSVIFVSKLHGLENVNLITGCSAGIVANVAEYGTNYLLYNPQDAGIIGANKFENTGDFYAAKGVLETKGVNPAKNHLIGVGDGRNVTEADTTAAMSKAKEMYLRHSHGATSEYDINDPVTALPLRDIGDDSENSFAYQFQHNGTVYIYVKDTESGIVPTFQSY